MITGKTRKSPWNIQGISSKTREYAMRTAYDAIKKGIDESTIEFNSRIKQYEFRGSKPTWMTSAIKRVFIQKISESVIGQKVRHIRSYGADYFLIEDKLLLCFKKMNRKGRVNGFSTKRFKSLMEGGMVQYSKAMLDVLAKMGIRKQVPIVFVGHILDSIGCLEDVRMVCYHNNEVIYMESLRHKFQSNLFSVQIEAREEEVLVKSKKSRKITSAKQVNE
jgi:hypothetical protein